MIAMQSEIGKRTDEIFGRMQQNKKKMKSNCAQTQPYTF